MRVSVSGPKLAALKASLKGTVRNLQTELAIAVNATANKSKSIINKEIRQELATTAGAVKKTIVITHKARPGQPVAFVQVKKEKRIPLRDFGARQTGKGVSYKISKTRGRKTIPNAFIVDRLGRHVFKRNGPDRLPISKPGGVSPYGVFTKGNRSQPSAEETQKELTKQVERRVRFILLKKSGKI